MRKSVVVTFAVGCVVSSVHGESAAVFSGLGDLPGGMFLSHVLAVSDDGLIVIGNSVTGVGPSGDSWEGFRWTQAEGMVRLRDVIGVAEPTTAGAVSADGSVIAGVVGNDAFRWTAPTGIVLLPPPVGFGGWSPTGVSADGAVLIGVANPPGGGTVAARWTQAAGVEILGALPNEIGFPDAFLTGVSANGNVATGNSFGLDGVHALHWTPYAGLLGMSDPIPGEPIYALGWDVSADGTTIVGDARPAAPAQNDEAFVWTQARGFLLIGRLPGLPEGSTATGVSSDGSIVVGSSLAVGGSMIWDELHGPRSIQTILTDDFGLNLDGWWLNLAFDVSVDGTVIVGNGVNPNGDTEAWMARIPRPSPPPIPAVSGVGAAIMALVMLSIGGVILAARTRRASFTVA